MSRFGLGFITAPTPSAPPIAFPSVYFSDGDTGADQNTGYSTNGTTYTLITPSMPTYGISENAYNGSGTWVACPPSSQTGINEVYVSTNPLAGWTVYPMSFMPIGVVWDGTQFVVCGDGGNVAYATNPTGSWTSWTSGVSTALYTIEYGNGKYAIGGATNVLRVATSLGGTFTSRYTSGTATTIFFIKYNSASSGRWLAGGTAGQLHYSTDANMAGTNWPRYALGSAQWNSANRDSSEWCMVGSSGIRAYCTDPSASVNWSTSSPFGGTPTMWCVKYSAALGLWVAFGINTLRTNTSASSGSWTNRMPAGVTGSQAARKGLLITS